MRRAIQILILSAFAASCSGGSTPETLAMVEEPLADESLTIGGDVVLALDIGEVIDWVVVAGLEIEDVVEGEFQCPAAISEIERLEGAEVKALDESGSIVAIERLRPTEGVVVAFDESSTFICRFPYSLNGEFVDATFMTIEVGDSSVTMSRSELEALDWTVDLPMG